MKDTGLIQEKAYEWGMREYPKKEVEYHAAFANSVCMLVAGVTGTYGGPSLREHVVSYSLMGKGGQLSMVNTAFGELPVYTSDGTLKQPGKWEFEEACAYAAPLVYGPITDFHRRIHELTKDISFDNSQSDLRELS